MSRGIYKTDDGFLLPYIHSGGNYRLLAALPRDRRKMAMPPRAADHYGELPESEWRDCDYSAFNPNVLDQGQLGACVGYSNAAMIRCVRAMAGMTDQALSPDFLYGLINGGVDGGAVVSDAMNALTTTGTCLASQVPYGSIYASRYSPDLYATAKRFRYARTFHVDSWGMVGTMLSLGFPVALGFVVASNFDQLDSTGTPPRPRGVDGGHAVWAYGLKRMPSGEWRAMIRNSWTADWGIGGNFLMPRYIMEYQQQDGIDGFAGLAAADDPEDVTNIPGGAGAAAA
jgi:hypothetical protein